MAKEQTINRTDSVRVKLAPEMLARVEKLATDFGMPVATLCAFAVAAWVRQQEQNAAMARMAVIDVSRRAFGQFDLDDDKLEKLFGPMVAEIAKAAAAQQLSLPLDREAPAEGAK